VLTETTIDGIRARVRGLVGMGARVALVPTMGALHEGHLTLVDIARQAADVVVVSIFANPLQFAPTEDFARYPRTLEADAAKLAERGATILFAPAVDEMFGDGSLTTVSPPGFATVLEGAVRPGHFSGVLTVVAKLFNIVQPNTAIFGRKDLQQLSMIRAMVRDLNFPVEVLAAETVREPDGLALSSRNRYLDEPSRRRATRLRGALVAAKAKFESGVSTTPDIETAGRSMIEKDAALSVDYFSVVTEGDFTVPESASRGDSIVAAVRIAGTRLLDNILL